MNPHGLSINVLHKFLDTARAYLELARKQSAMPRAERGAIARLQSVPKTALLELECHKNAPA